MSEKAKKAIQQICELCDGNESVRLGVELACTVIESQRSAEPQKEESDENLD